MRFEKKYKKFAKQQIFITNSPILRLLKFKRTKWLKTKAVCQKILRRTKRNSYNRYHNYYTNLQNTLFKQRYDRLKKFYLQGVQFKRAVNLLFDNKLSTTNYKKLLTSSNSHLTYRDQFLFTIMKPFFFIEILLWKLGYFKSPYAVLQAIYSGWILVNNKRLNGSVVLKKYDYISFNRLIPINNFNLKNKKEFFSFVEIDRYTQEIILLKDFSSLTKIDVCLLLPESLKIKPFLNYIKNK